MKKVLLDFVEYAIAKKIAFYRTIISRLTNNQTFPQPDPTIDILKQRTDALEQMFVKAQDGGRTAMANLRSAEDAADLAFRSVAMYVYRIAMGDETKIINSGFLSSKDRATVQKAEFSVIDGANSGSVRYVVKAIPTAGAYIWQVAKGTTQPTESDWTIAGYSTQTTFDAAGIEPGTKCSFRFAAICTDGVTDFSAPITKIVI